MCILSHLSVYGGAYADITESRLCPSHMEKLHRSDGGRGRYPEFEPGVNGEYAEILASGNCESLYPPVAGRNHLVNWSSYHPFSNNPQKLNPAILL